jgi:Fur family ferric uptake transcriptional regulator
MSCEEVFYQRLRERGFRLTPQREIILSVLHQVEGLVTAEEIHQKVREISQSIDISTVYRTLELLQDFHLVASVDPGDGQHRYELLELHGPHIHLVCQRCGKILGVGLDKIEPLIACAEETYGFHVDVDQLTIPGLCETCAVGDDPDEV